MAASTPVYGSLRAVLFDASGTLIQLREPVGETYSREARSEGVELSPWRFGDAFGRVLRSAPPRVFPEAGQEAVAALERSWWRDRVRETLRAADSAAVLDDFERYFDRLYQHYGTAAAWQLAEGAKECLESLRESGLKTGIVSNFDHRLIPLLDELQLASLLDAVILSGHVGAAKPDPAPFQAALAKLGCAASAAVYVGDNPSHDRQGAIGAGLAAIERSELATLADLPARLAGRTE